MNTIQYLLSTLVTLSIYIGAPILGQVRSQPDASPESVGFSVFNTPLNLGTTINSVDNDELSVLAPNGLSLYFASTRPGGLGAFDIYVSRRSTLWSPWGPPENLGAIVNSSSGDSPTGISPDGREMFINSQRPGGSGGVDIWVTTRNNPADDFGWSTPVNLGPIVNSASADQNAAYYVDPTTGLGTLYFASDRGSATAGIKDLYQSIRNSDGSFTAPTLVAELNSSGDEARPAISRDGLEIFFDSNRLGPSTTFAIFSSTRATRSSPWNAPVYVNSLSIGGNARQPFISNDGSAIYFTSNRAGGIGGGDQYQSSRASIHHVADNDFDGDGRTDIGIFRPSDGNWWILQSGTNTVTVQQFGRAGDRVVSGDYDGDGRTDLAVFRPSDRTWYTRRSSDNSVSIFNWGLENDRPVPGDYDGDGRTDIAVYRDGVWYIVQSSTGTPVYHSFGLSDDIPVTGKTQ